MTKTATLYYDGGCRPTNPGRAGFAAVLTIHPDDVKVVARKLGWQTNNVAEYHGLIVGLKLARDNRVDVIDIFTDSKLIVGHLTKDWRVGPELRVYFREAQLLLGDFETWTLTWIKREDNSKADALCTKTILEQQAENPWVVKLAARSSRVRAHAQED